MDLQSIIFIIIFELGISLIIYIFILFILSFEEY